MKQRARRVGCAAFAAGALLTPAASARAGVAAPLEVHPAQGPRGSSAIVVVPGLRGGEQVRVVVDGETRTVTARTYGDGTLTLPLTMPDAPGLHRIAVEGIASMRPASGTFTTTPDGTGRPSMVAAPRPLVSGPNPSRPWLADIFAVNFAPSTELTLRCPCQDEGYATFDFGKTDGNGDASGSFDFDIADYGVIDLALSEGPGLSGHILAGDGVVKRSPAYDPARRVRVVPEVGGSSGRMFVVGTGFPPGARVDVDEDGRPAGSVTADGDGGVVAFDDDAPPTDNPTTATRLTAGGVFGAAASARTNATVRPTAGVTRDVVPPGGATRVVAAGLPHSSPVAILGVDRNGGQFVLGTGTSRTDGGLDPVTVTLPGDVPPGPYRIEVDAGDRMAYASLAVDGDIDPLTITAPRPDPTEPGTAALGLRVPKRIKLARFTRRGAPARIDLRSLACDPGCAVALQLVVGKRVVGVRTATVRAQKTVRLAVKPSRKNARRLRRRRTVKAAVRVAVVDARARRARGERRLTARR